MSNEVVIVYHSNENMRKTAVESLRRKFTSTDSFTIGTAPISVQNQLKQQGLVVNSLETKPEPKRAVQITPKRFSFGKKKFEGMSPEIAFSASMDDEKISKNVNISNVNPVLFSFPMAELSMEPEEAEELEATSPEPPRVKRKGKDLSGKARKGKIKKLEEPSPTKESKKPRKEPYVLGFWSPFLTREQQESLKEKGVDIVERLPNSTYLVLLTDLNSVASDPLLRSIERYADREDPVLHPETSKLCSRKSTGKNNFIAFTIRLFDAEMCSEMTEWLKSEHIQLKYVKGKVIVIELLLPKQKDLIKQIKTRPEVHIFEERAPRVLANDNARIVLGISTGEEINHASSLEFKGKGQIIGIADTGLDITHPGFLPAQIETIALGGRLGNATDDPDGHGTHVAGSAVGNGSGSTNNAYAGIAPEARLVFQSIFMDDEHPVGGLPYDLSELFKQAHTKGVTIHNNSWTSTAPGQYDNDTYSVDEFASEHPDMLIVFAAGNDGTAASPTYTNRGYVDWGSVQPPSTSKNALTIGATRANRPSKITFGDMWPDDFPDPPISLHTISGDPECLAAFSSRGPSNDMRIKPDLVAPGCDVISAKSSIAPDDEFRTIVSNHYASLCGTSMAAPLVTGCAALIRQYYIDKRGWSPSAALLKATLINGARKLSGNDVHEDERTQLPNFHQGFGRVNVLDSIPNSTNPNLKLAFEDDLGAFKVGKDIVLGTTARGSIPLKICLTWTDFPGRGIQNSLAFSVKSRSKKTVTYANYERQGKEFTRFPKVDYDFFNNVQTVCIMQPDDEYTITIVCHNLVSRKQKFALVVTGDLDSDQLTKISVPAKAINL